MQPRPSRVMGRLDAVFWQFCNLGELRLQQCAHCGRVLWPPAPVCDTCLTEDLVWSRMSGRGTVKAHCIFERQYYPELPSPWPVILVELPEGPWFVSNPRGVRLEDLWSGLEMQVAFIDCVDGHGPFRLPVFEPVHESDRSAP